MPEAATAWRIGSGATPTPRMWCCALRAHAPGARFRCACAGTAGACRGRPAGGVPRRGGPRPQRLARRSHGLPGAAVRGRHGRTACATACGAADRATRCGRHQHGWPPSAWCLPAAELPLAAPVRRLVLNDVGPAIEAEAIARIASYVGQGSRLRQRAGRGQCHMAALHHLRAAHSAAVAGLVGAHGGAGECAQRRWTHQGRRSRGSRRWHRGAAPTTRPSPLQSVPSRPRSLRRPKWRPGALYDGIHAPTLLTRGAGVRPAVRGDRPADEPTRTEGPARGVLGRRPCADLRRPRRSAVVVSFLLD